MTAHEDEDHAPYEALAAGFALSALEPEDEELFLTHRSSCDSCARAAADHQDTLAQLACTAAIEEPPPSLIADIRAGLAVSGRSVAAPRRQDLTRSTRRRLRAPALPRLPALLAAAASVVVVAALLVVGHGLTTQERDAQLTASRLSTAVSSLLVPGAHTVDLEGYRGRGAVLVNGSSVSLVLSGLGVNDRHNSIYVLWQKTTFGDVRAVGSFDVTSVDVTVVNGLQLASADTVKTFIVTKERGRSAPVRTVQPPLLAGAA